MRKKLLHLHGVHQLQTGALTALRERHETCENIAQAMALELHRIREVFREANEQFDPPLPLDSINALLDTWRQYADQKEKL